MVWVLCWPGNSLAMFGEEDWLNGQNTLMVKLLATEMGSATDIASILSNIKMVTEATNEGLALARASYRAYQAVRDESVDQLLDDAKEGLYQAFPDLRVIDADGNLLIDQWDHRGDFFTYRNKFDMQISPLAKKLFEHAYQATIWPAVFPNAMRAHANATPVELRIWERYMRTQQDMDVLLKKTSLAALAKKVQNLMADAEKSKNLEIGAQALQAELSTQLVNDVSEISDLVKSEVAAEEEARGNDRERRRSLRKGLGKDFGQMLLPGGGMVPLGGEGK